MRCGDKVVRSYPLECTGFVWYNPHVRYFKIWGFFMIGCVVGIDPGASGAMCLYDACGKSVVDVVDYSTTEAMHDTLIFWRELYSIKNIALESVHCMKGNGSKSDTTFQQHTGEWICLCKLSGAPWCVVRPQVWGKCRVKRKRHMNDKPAVDYVHDKYPSVNLLGPRGGIKDGRADAVCIAEWASEQL